MRIFGFEVSRTKAAPVLSPVADNRGGWTPWIREPYSGAWQRNDEWTVDTVLAHYAVFACITLISNDVGKLRNKLVEMSAVGTWDEVSSSAFSPVLRKPNRYQTHIQFKEWWMHSKLMRGNTYALKERDDRGVVRRLYLLDPSRVLPLVAPDGSIFYQLGQDNLTGLQDASVKVPASEIIHDRINCLFHPLVGLSPLFAAGHAANLGLKIQTNSSAFFGNGSTPSGILTAPGKINQQAAEQMEARWQQAFTGPNSGKVAVLAEGLKYEPMRMTSQESQMLEQEEWTGRAVCAVFHVPPFKIGIGPMPTYQNAEVLNQIYYADCLQSHIEQYEAVMDEGLGLLETKEGKQLGVELDLDNLLRMDTATQYSTLEKGVKGGFLAPNEARLKVNLKPLKGGDTVYLQQQNYSLAALDERDRANPAPSQTTGGSSPSPSSEPDEDDEAETRRAIEALIASYDFEATAKGAP